MRSSRTISKEPVSGSSRGPRQQPRDACPSPMSLTGLSGQGAPRPHREGVNRAAGGVEGSHGPHPLPEWAASCA